MASYLRPRRGKKATAISQLTASAPLKRGEVFFEVPDAGTGTGKGKIKMGDGSTAYENLPYFLEPFDADNATIGFTDSSSAESSPYTTNAGHVNAIVPSANLKTIFTNLKQLLLNFNSQLTTLNNDLSVLNSSLTSIYDVTSELQYRYCKEVSGRNKLIKCGNMMFLTVVVVTTTALTNSENHIIKIPKKYLPKQSVYGAIHTNAYGMDVIPFAVVSTLVDDWNMWLSYQKLNNQTIPTDRWLWGTISWIIGG